MKVEKREEASYDKLAEDKKAAIRESLANPKLNDYMMAEQEKLEIEVSLPKEEEAPAEDAGADDNAGAGNDAGAGAEEDAAKE